MILRGFLAGLLAAALFFAARELGPVRLGAVLVAIALTWLLVGWVAYLSSPWHRIDRGLRDRRLRW